MNAMRKADPREAKKMSGRTRAQYRTGKGQMKASIIRQYRVSLPGKPMQLQFRRPEELYPYPDNPGVGTEELVILRYGIKRGERFMPVVRHPSQDLIDVYRQPERVDDEGNLVYGDLLASDKAQLALQEGRWLENFQIETTYIAQYWMLEWFHMVTLKSVGSGTNRKVVRAKNPSKEDKTWDDRLLCEGRNCVLCEEGWPKVFGKRGFTEFSYPRWWGTMDLIRNEVERYPVQGGYLYPLYYQCPNEECLNEEGVRNIMRVRFQPDEDDPRTVDQDMDLTLQCFHCGAVETEEDPVLSIDHETHEAQCIRCHKKWPLVLRKDPLLRRLVQQEQECLHCGEKGFPEAVMAHMWTEEEDYDNPPLDPADVECRSMFDYTYTIWVDEEDRYRLHVDDFEYTPEPDPRLLDPQCQGLEELGKERADKEIERMMEPLDIQRAYEPMDPEQVAKLLDIPNLFDPEVNGNASEKKQRMTWSAGRSKPRS